jgi:hypothetical protein
VSFAAINGAVLAIADGEASVTTEAIGSSDRNVAGTMVPSIRAVKAAYSVTVTPETMDARTAWQKLLRGYGDVWHFDESTGNNWQWSVNGRPAASGVANGSSLASGKFSRGLRILAAHTVTWTTNTGSNWTIMVWYYTGGAWHHYIVRSDAAKWVDGVRNDSATTTFMGNTSTTTTLGNPASGGNQDFDDLVVLPYKVTAPMAEAFGMNTAAFSDLPALTLRGDLTDGESVTVRCVAESSTDVIQGVSSGTFQPLGATSYELAEQ